MLPMAAPRRRKAMLIAIAAACWIIAFSGWFFTREMPNQTTTAADGTVRVLTRADLWLYWFTEPASVLNPVSTSFSGEPAAARWSNLWLRRREIAAATAVWLTIAAFGAAWSAWLLPHGGPLRKAERFVVAAGVGASLFTTWVLICGRAGQMGLFWILLPILPCCVLWITGRRRQLRLLGRSGGPVGDAVGEDHSPLSLRAGIGLGCLLLPFVLTMLPGSLTPPFDFDVREYHMQGPKEWFLEGRITFLEHNVYTSFPFLSEMFSLSGMQLLGDWKTGAIAGKAALSGFQLLTALAVWCCAKRIGGTAAAALGVSAWLMTPWTTRITLIAYAEGALTFYVAAVLMVLTAVAATRQPVSRSLLVTFGLLAGAGMACKYTGLVLTVMPVFVFVLVDVFRRRSSDPALLHESHGPSESAEPLSFRTVSTEVLVCLAGVLIAIGPWMLRNLADTGNPVYPLVSGVLGGVDLDAQFTERFRNAHRAPEHDMHRIPLHLADLAVRNDWQNGLLFALAVPVGLFAVRRYHLLLLPLLLSVWLIGTWWALTHRIDRFWVPVLPCLAVLAGSAMNLSDHRGWRGFLILVLVVHAVFCLTLNRTGVVGLNTGLLEPAAASAKSVRPDFRYLNETLPSDALVLMVGEAEVFDGEFRCLYNTTFDDSVLLQVICSPAVAADESREAAFRAGDAFQALKDSGVTHLLVNWSEILRYRRPGSYGYDNRISPELWERLTEQGVLGQPEDLGVIPFSSLSSTDHALIESWPGAHSILSEQTGFRARRLYPLAAEAPNLP